MVVGVKFHSVITTSVSLEDRLDNRGDFYRQNLLSTDDIVSLVTNVELYFT